MNPTIQQQLNELKATLEAIRIGIGVLEARLDQDAQEHQLDGGCTEKEGCECVNCTTARADFNAWADDYNRRHPYPSNMTFCYFCGKTATTTRNRPDGGMKDCAACKDCADIIDEGNNNERQAYESDPSYNGHPSSFR